jgi:hypothetical protein
VKISSIPFGTTDWSLIERTEHRGETGMSYQVADQAEPHRSFTVVGAKLFIVD